MATPKIVVQTDDLFLIELMASPVERGFIQALHADPDDPVTRNAYADFLKEQGRHLTADRMLKGTLIPGGQIMWDYGYGGGLPTGTFQSGAGFPYSGVIG